MSDQREMTLDEYLESKLPDFHLARRQLQELREERDALAAHVERLTRLADPVVGLCQSCLDEDEDVDALWKAVQNEPTTSLARLKAEWQAEALAEMIAAIPFREELARDMLRHRRDELRRQAEGGDQ